MSLATLAKRGPGRPPNPKKTPVQLALEAPLPDGLDAALEKVDRARASLERFKESREESVAADEDVRLQLHARRIELNSAVIKREMADRYGDDDGSAPALDEIQTIEREIASLEARSGDREARRAAFDREVAGRETAYKEAGRELRHLMALWMDVVIAAGDEQLGEAAKMAAEAYVAARRLQPFRNVPFISLHPLDGEANHRGPDDVPLPAAVTKAVTAIQRSM